VFSQSLATRASPRLRTRAVLVTVRPESPLPWSHETQKPLKGKEEATSRLRKKKENSDMCPEPRNSGIGTRVRVRGGVRGRRQGAGRRSRGSWERGRVHTYASLESTFGVLVFILGFCVYSKKKTVMGRWFGRGKVQGEIQL
jgi:hypothetical protein